MGMEALFQGLQAFNQGLQQYSTSKAIGDATEAVNQLNQSAITEQEKRVEQMRLGNQLALHLSALGAPASQIQSATGAIKPEQFSSPQEMMMKGMLEGKQDLVKQGEQMAAKFAAPGIASEERAFGRQVALQKLKGQQDVDLEAMKLGAKTRDAKAGDVSFATNVRQGLSFVKDLKKTVSDYGTYENAYLGNAEAAAKLESLPYQMAITYAKIVDPDSVAREGEVQAAQKYMIDLGATSNKGKAIKQLEHMEKTIKEYAKTRASASGKADAVAAAPALTRITHKGQTFEGYYLPSGDFQPTRQVSK